MHSIRRCIYPGSFDPITNGHLDIIIRCAALFDEIIIAVALGHHKKTLFNLSERTEMLEMVLKNKNINVKVIKMENLLVNFCEQNNCYNIIRGVRVISDFDYEFQLAWANKLLNKKIETIFLTPDSSNTHISGRLVREIAKLKGDISLFIPPEILKTVKEKIKI